MLNKKNLFPWEARLWVAADSSVEAVKKHIYIIVMISNDSRKCCRRKSGSKPRGADLFADERCSKETTRVGKSVPKERPRPAEEDSDASAVDYASEPEEEAEARRLAEMGIELGLLPWVCMCRGERVDGRVGTGGAGRGEVWRRWRGFLGRESSRMHTKKSLSLRPRGHVPSAVKILEQLCRREAPVEELGSEPSEWFIYLFIVRTAWSP